jgi:hypothetical protein
MDGNVINIVGSLVVPFAIKGAGPSRLTPSLRSSSSMTIILDVDQCACRKGGTHVTQMIGASKLKGSDVLRNRAFPYAVSASTIQALSPDVMHLARLIAGEKERDPVVWEAARQVAVAAIDVVRVRRARTELPGQMSQGAYFYQFHPLEPMPTQFLSYKSSSLDERIRAVLDGTIDELHRMESAQIMRVFKARGDTASHTTQRASAAIALGVGSV